MNAQNPPPPENESVVPGKLPGTAKLPELEPRGTPHTIPNSPQAWGEFMGQFQEMCANVARVAARVEENTIAVVELQDMVSGYAVATEKASAAAQRAADAAIAALTAMEQRGEQLDQLLAEHRANHPHLKVATRKD